MPATAKIFTTGNSQAVRLPKAFRLAGDEVWIRKDALTGEIILTPKDAEVQRLKRIDDLMSLIATIDNHDEFLPPRDTTPARNPFEDWAEVPPDSSESEPRP